MPRIVKPAPVRREEILHCAFDLFARQGYDATSINQVIDCAGISKGAFYHHFSSKEELLEAMAAQLAADAAENARHIISDETLDPFARLSRFLNSAREQKRNDMPRLQRAFEPLFRPENLDLYYRTHIASATVIEPMLAELIREGIADRTFDTPDPESAAEVILRLMAATRDDVTRVLYARTVAEQDEAIGKLARKVSYIGTVVDRILGLPDGSVELGDVEFLRSVAAPPEKNAVPLLSCPVRAT